MTTFCKFDIPAFTATVRKKAKLLLARAYLGSREFGKAVAAFDEVVAAQPVALEDDKVLLPYLEALLGAGEHDKLAQTIADMQVLDAAEFVAKYGG